MGWSPGALRQRRSHDDHPESARHLLVRFAIISAVLVTVLTVTLCWYFARLVERRALSDAEAIATALVGGIDGLFEASDLSSEPLGEDRFDELRSSIGDRLDGSTVQRIKVMNTDAVVVYSDVRELIGQEVPRSDHLLRSLDGEIVSKLKAADDTVHRLELDFGPQLEVFVPIQRSGSTDAVAVIEIYLPYGEVQAGIDADVRQLSMLAVGGLLVLWLTLFRVVHSASVRLHRESERTRWMAEHDGLTGLANRGLFESTVEAALSEASTSSGPVAVLVDLNRFKSINDNFGHHTGDAVLQHVANRLQAVVRPNDLVARLGGDEFAVLLRDVDDTRVAAELAERVAHVMEEPIEVEELVLDVGASIGVATGSSDRSFEQLLLQADLAMYAAKNEARPVAFYEPAMDVEIESRVLLFGDLRRALVDGGIEVHFQPKFSLRDRRVCGVEALARWSHPRHGAVSPDRFVPLAEQTGLAPRLTELVVRSSLGRLAEWRTRWPDLSLAVNLSARELYDEHVVDLLVMALADANLPPSAIQVEITETSAMVDPVRSLEVLDSLNAAGIGVAVDDYGTGHSSLAYLQSLPVQTLKIDKTFVLDLATSEANQTIVRSTVDLAQALGLAVVAEGVEDEGAMDLLRRFGVDEVQGYWLARPTEPANVVNAIDGINARLEMPLLVRR